MKIDGRCHCGYITYEAEIDPDKTLDLPLHRLPNAVGLRVPRGRVHSGRCFHVALRRTENLRQDQRKREQDDHNRSARNVERQFMRRRRAKDPRSTPFDWAQFVNATRSFRMRRSGFDPRSHGSLTLSQFGKSKSSRRSTRLARYISLNGRKTPKAGLLRAATSPLGPEQTSGALSSKSAFEGTTDIAIRSRVRSASLRFEGH